MSINMTEDFYSLEKPIAQLKERIDAVRLAGEPGAADEVAALRREIQTEWARIQPDLSPTLIVQIARHPKRPYTLDYIKALTQDFLEIHGDRRFADDPAIVAGFAFYKGSTIAIVGHQKGRTTRERIERNFGQMNPEGYRKALRVKGRFDSALEAYERVLALDGVNQAAKKGLLAVAETRKEAKLAKKVAVDKVPVLRLTAVALAQQRFDPQGGFVLSRINGSWDVRSILKLCPLPEDEVLVIFTRPLDRGAIELK